LEKSRKVKADKQSATPASPRIDARRQPRVKIEIDITIISWTSGILKGYTVDIGESGIAAMLPIEAPLGETVELSFALPCGPLRIHAIVRQRNAFRYGFEFVDQDLVHEFIRRTCRDLAIEQSPMLANVRWRGLLSFRVPVTILLIFVTFIVRDVSFVLVFVIFLVWFLSTEDIGICPRTGLAGIFGKRICACRTAPEGSPAHRQSFWGHSWETLNSWLQSVQIPTAGVARSHLATLRRRDHVQLSSFEWQTL
jgi:hypothetical protein